MIDEPVETTRYREKVTSTLDRIFLKALETSGFETICAVLRVGGMADANWDPFEESSRAFEDYNWLLSKAVAERSAMCQRHMGLLMYCQVVEMTAAQEITANLLRCHAGQQYVMNPFGHLSRSKKKELFSYIPPSVSAKYRELKRLAVEVKEPALPELIDAFFDERIRNAFSHSDYVLTEDYFRYSKGGLLQQMSMSELDRYISACFEFFGPFQGLHRTWLHQLSTLPRYHKWPNYEVLEILSTEAEGVYGFSIHFSNGSKATYTRRTSGIDAMNVMFQKGGTVNFFCGSIDALQPVWKIDGTTVTDWDYINRRD